MAWVERPVWALDHTAWPCLRARTLRDRTLEHQLSGIPGAVPITIGQGYSTFVWVPEERGSWALPLLHEQISSLSDPIQQVVAQLRVGCLGRVARLVCLLEAE